MGGLGVGSGLCRGSGVDVGGSERKTPCCVDEIGHVVMSWFRRVWAPSRAVALMRFLSFTDSRKMGLGSIAVSLPRSNVYGVGFVTVIGLPLFQIVRT